MLRRIGQHAPALFTALVWGSTFVASKHVLGAGLTPPVLMLVRFALAYALLWCFCREHRKIRLCTEELKYLVLGLSGGSLYFWLEYEALKRTAAVNVGLLSATVPLVSTAMAIAIGRARASKNFVVGSVVALVGAVLVILNGDFGLTVMPVGDLIAVASVVLWAAYTVVLSTVDAADDPLFVSRRLFFYALVSMLPLVLLNAEAEDFAPLMRVDVLLPTAYLGVMASSVCMWLWHVSVRRIGLQQTNNYLYLLPVVAVLTSAIFVGAEITVYNLVGSLFILVGIIIADRR